MTIYNAPECDCGVWEVPQMLQITMFGDPCPRWIVEWRCPNEMKAGHQNQIQYRLQTFQARQEQKGKKAKK